MLHNQQQYKRLAPTREHTLAACDVLTILCRTNVVAGAVGSYGVGNGVGSGVGAIITKYYVKTQKTSAAPDVDKLLPINTIASISKTCAYCALYDIITRDVSIASMLN
jgi:hypothetical protein